MGSGSVTELDSTADSGSGSVREASKGRGSESESTPFGGGELGKGIAAGDNGWSMDSGCSATN